MPYSTEKFQPLVCKKCGESNLYHPKEDEDTGNWPRINDRFDPPTVQAFERGFNIPHWYICDANPQGHEHRKKLMDQMSDFERRQTLKREEIAIRNTPTHPHSQQHLPSERLTPLDREISAKLNVMELILEDIKRLMQQKAADI